MLLHIFAPLMGLVAWLTLEYSLYTQANPGLHLRGVLADFFKPKDRAVKAMLFLLVSMCLFSLWESVFWATLGQWRPWWRVVIGLLAMGFVLVQRWKFFQKTKSFAWNQQVLFAYVLGWALLVPVFTAMIFAVWIIARTLFVGKSTQRK